MLFGIAKSKSLEARGEAKLTPQSVQISGTLADVLTWQQLNLSATGITVMVPENQKGGLSGRIMAKGKEPIKLPLVHRTDPQAPLAWNLRPHLYVFMRPLAPGDNIRVLQDTAIRHQLYAPGSQTKSMVQEPGVSGS